MLTLSPSQAAGTMDVEEAMAHRVALLVDGALVQVQPAAARGVYLFEWRGDGPCRVEGALIDDRFVRRDKPQVLSPGESFEVTSDDVVYALERVRPLERCPSTGLQVVDLACGDPAADTGLTADGPVSVVTPEVLLDPPELPAVWMERTYCRRSPDGLHPEGGYERDLVVRLPSVGRRVLRACRPAGVNEDGTLVLRYHSFEEPTGE